MRLVIAALVLALFAPVIADAQPGRGGGAAMTPAQRRERIKNRIRAIRAGKLVETFGEQTTAKMLPVLAKYDDEFDKLLQQRAEIDRRLASAAEGNDPKVAEKAIDEAVANQRAFWEADDQRLVELRKSLTPAQVARLLVVLPPLERRIQNQLRNAIQRQQQQGARRQGGPAPGIDDYDDDDDDAPPARPGLGKRKSPDDCDPFTAMHGCK